MQKPGPIITFAIGSLMPPKTIDFLVKRLPKMLGNQIPNGVAQQAPGTSII